MGKYKGEGNMKLIEGFHVRRMENGKEKINYNKRYRWKIPIRLDGEIDKGDIVWVRCKSGDRYLKNRVLVLDIIECDEKELRSVIKVSKKFKDVNLDLD
jgi:hypothetical protein